MSHRPRLATVPTGPAPLFCGVCQSNVSEDLKTLAARIAELEAAEQERIRQAKAEAKLWMASVG